MSSGGLQPADASFRSPHVKRACVKEVLASFEQNLVEARGHLEAGVGGPSSTAGRLGRVRHYADSLARLRFISGADLESVRVAFEESVGAHCEMCRPEHDAERWRTSSKHSLHAMYVASAIARLDLLREIAKLLTWDHPDNSHVHVCTIAEHHLAYTLKALVFGDRTAAAAELKRVRSGRLDVQLEWSMARAILRGSKAQFVEPLTKLLAWNARYARLAPDTAPPEFGATQFLLCTPALGLAGLALRAGVVEQSDLPATDPYFPQAFLDSNA